MFYENANWTDSSDRVKVDPTKPQPELGRDRKSMFAVLCAWCKGAPKRTKELEKEGYGVSHGQCEYHIKNPEKRSELS